MRELTRGEYEKYIEPYRQILMNDPEFLELYRATKVPICFNILANRIQEKVNYDYIFGELPCAFFISVGTETEGYRLKYKTDCDVIPQLPDEEEFEDEDDEDKTSLSDYSDEELLLELLCRAHRR